MGQSLNGSSEEHAGHSAAGMIAVYGGEAERICQAQIEKMRRRRDLAGEQNWRSVLDRIVQQRSLP